MQDGSLAATSVQDHGIGSSAARMDWLFGAFYTTKPQGMPFRLR